MTARQIVDKFRIAFHKLVNDYNNDKIWFEIYLCEEYETHASQTFYKFSRIEDKDNTILLKTRRGKVVKILTKNNVAWISCIVIRDKNLVIKLVDYDFADLKELKEYDQH